jgi:hypothetical protein
VGKLWRNARISRSGCEKHQAEVSQGVEQQDW